MPSKSYVDLIVWQNAMDLVPAIYEVVRTLPAGERYALADQLRRAAVSVPANIAEGQQRQHTREFIQHLMIAKGSLAELHTLILIAARLKYIPEYAVGEIETRIASVRGPLIGLIGSIRPPRQL